MDGYYAKEFQQYGKGQPYMSLIFARDRNGSFYFTGRVFDGGDWYPVTDIFTVGDQRERDPCQVRDSLPGAEDETGGENSLTPESTTARLESLLGRAASKRLTRSTVGVLGCSGTGSRLSTFWRGLVWDGSSLSILSRFPVPMLNGCTEAGLLTFSYPNTDES